MPAARHPATDTHGGPRQAGIGSCRTKQMLNQAKEAHDEEDDNQPCHDVGAQAAPASRQGAGGPLVLQLLQATRADQPAFDVP